MFYFILNVSMLTFFTNRALGQTVRFSFELEELKIAPLDVPSPHVHLKRDICKRAEDRSYQREACDTSSITRSTYNI
jgi:hypothetical protein